MIHFFEEHLSELFLTPEGFSAPLDVTLLGPEHFFSRTNMGPFPAEGSSLPFDKSLKPPPRADNLTCSFVALWRQLWDSDKLRQTHNRPNENHSCERYFWLEDLHTGTRIRLKRQTAPFICWFKATGIRNQASRPTATAASRVLGAPLFQDPFPQWDNSQ